MFTASDIAERGRRKPLPNPFTDLIIESRLRDTSGETERLILRITGLNNIQSLYR